MNTPQQFAGHVLPDPRDISLQQVAELGDCVLAQSLALYRKRLAENGPQHCAFESSI